MNKEARAYILMYNIALQFVQNRSQVAAATPQARQRPAQPRTPGTKTTNSTSQSTVQSPVVSLSYRFVQFEIS